MKALRQVRELKWNKRDLYFSRKRYRTNIVKQVRLSYEKQTPERNTDYFQKIGAKLRGKIHLNMKDRITKCQTFWLCGRILKMCVTFWSAKQYSRYHWINSKHIIGAQGQWLHICKIFEKSLPLVKSRQSSNLVLALILIESFAFNTVSKWEQMSSNLILPSSLHILGFCSGFF